MTTPLQSDQQLLDCSSAIFRMRERHPQALSLTRLNVPPNPRIGD
jgi:hypothetical protein